LWSVISIACPFVVIFIAFGVGYGNADERLAFRIVGIAAICFFGLTFIGLVCVFLRRERLRWFTLVSLLLFFAMFGLGISL
jgi:hypothetical protein